MLKRLELDDISVNYGEVSGVRNLSLTVGPGEVVALLGANGAGKSTTLKAIMGMVKTVGGAITVNGEDLRARGAIIESELAVRDSHGDSRGLESPCD